MKERLSGIVCLLLILSASLLSAQTGLGELSGFIRNDESAAIVGAEITVAGSAIMGDRRAMSGSRGEYRIINLPPGKYTIIVSKENYQTQEIKNISVRAGKTSSFNIAMQVGDFEDTITITHDAPIIDLKNTERRINIDGTFIDRLPLSTTREWTSVLSLVPSVVTDDEFTGGGALGDSYSSVRFHGAASGENMFSMDGAAIQTDTGYDPVLFTSAIIEDVEIVTSGYNSSMRSGLGGYINVVTKSGGNDLQGTFQIALQPESWNWENVEEGNTPKSELYLPEVSIGGPIRNDRVWFFASFLYDYRNQGIFRDADALFWLEQNGFSKSDYDYVDERRSARFFGKVTAALTDSDKIVATFNWDRTENLFGYDYIVDSGRGLNKTGGPLFILNYTKAFGDNLVTSLQGAYRKAVTGEFPRSGDLSDVQTEIWRYGEVVRFGSRIAFGDFDTVTVSNGPGSPFSNSERHVELNGDVNLFVEDLWGSHDARFGVYYLPERKFDTSFTFAQPFNRVLQARNESGDWVTYFASQFKENVEGNEFINSNAAVYFQDSWTLNGRMTVNYGFRAEKNFDEVEVFRETTFSPNFGLSYALTSDQKQVLRFSYSRKQEVLNNTELVSTFNPSTNGGASFYYDDDIDGVWDRITNFPDDDIIPNSRDSLLWFGAPVEVDDNLGPSHADYFQIGYSAVLPWNITFDAAFLYNIFSDTPTRYRFANFAWENNQPVALRDPSVTEKLFWANNTWSSTHYSGLEFSLSRSFRDNWQMLASYSYQTTTEKGEWSPYDPERYYFPSGWFEYTDSQNGPKHVFRLAASYLGPFGIMFNGNIAYRSSLPNTAYRFRGGVGIDVPRSITLSGRRVTHPFWRMRNWAQPRSADREGFIDGVTAVNLGIGKMFDLFGYRLETQLQIFNVFNDNTGISGFGLVVDENLEYESTSIFQVQAPRAAQLLVKLSF